MAASLLLTQSRNNENTSWWSPEVPQPPTHTQPSNYYIFCDIILCIISTSNCCCGSCPQSLDLSPSLFTPTFKMLFVFALIPSSWLRRRWFDTSVSAEPQRCYWLYTSSTNRAASPFVVILFIEKQKRPFFPPPLGFSCQERLKLSRHKRTFGPLSLWGLNLF